MIVVDGSSNGASRRDANHWILCEWTVDDEHVADHLYEGGISELLSQRVRGGTSVEGRGIEDANLEKLMRIESLRHGADGRFVDTILTDVHDRIQRMCERSQVCALFWR